jgi:hypothetical protein
MYQSLKRRKTDGVVIRKYMNEIYMGSAFGEYRNGNNEIDDNNGRYEEVTVWNGIEREI